MAEEAVQSELVSGSQIPAKLRKIQGSSEYRNFSKLTLGEAMTREPDTIPLGKIAIEALRLMEDGLYRHLPIVDDGRVVGIVSRFDFSGMELDRLNEETGLWERI